MGHHKTCKRCGSAKVEGRCKPCRDAWIHEYRKSINFKRYTSEYIRRNDRLANRKKSNKKYRATEKFKIKQRSKQQAYYHSVKGNKICKEYQKEYHKTYKYSNGYISKLLIRQGIEPTDETMESKRLQLKIKRKIYEIEREIKSPGNYVRPNNVLQGLSSNRNLTPKYAANH